MTAGAEKVAVNADAEEKKLRATKEWRLIERLIMSLQSEQRKSRRWGIFFKSLTFLYLFAILGVFLLQSPFSSDALDSAPHTAVVQVNGPIANGQDANADAIIHSLRSAFKAEDSKAVLVRINSPGGSPVQSGYVYDEIKRLRLLYPEKKLYAVITDIGASGAYYIAAAADEIYADKASLVGSIGVVSSGFGFVDLMSKLGVERRALTAGDNKALLDPFSPLREEDRQFWQTVLDTTHKQFIEQVKLGRGERLQDNPDLYTGLVWTGEQALELGLVDGLASSSTVARDIVGAEQLIEYSPQVSPLKELADQLGVSFAKAMSTQLGLDTPVRLQ
ncbi:signal peptide peptidase SppA [Amphritea spongicola]|nr:signal peptide peptidase SppA [Aliamphritea spongicola]MBN3561271.1 signal peptide peptidase SppA [Aliamphritea spongicola]